MDEARQREIARKGGKAAHQRGTAHEFTAEEAAEAGRKGGKAVSQNRQHMAEIGRKGGKAAHQRGNSSLAGSAAQQDQGNGEELRRQEENAPVSTEPTPERGSAQQWESGAAGAVAGSPEEAAMPRRNGAHPEHGNGASRSGNGQQSAAVGQPTTAGAQ
jgi:general stress protein YciG